MTYAGLFSFTFQLIVALFTIYVVVLYIIEYRQAGIDQPNDTKLRRVFHAAYDSGTILWTKFCVVVAFVASQLDNIVDLLGAPELKDFINTWVGDPKVIAAIILSLTAVTYFARMRKGSQDPIVR